MARSLTALRELFATTDSLEALLDTPREVWARRQQGFVYVLDVWRDGKVVSAAGPSELPTSNVKERRTWWNLRRGLVIDEELHDQGTVVRRAQLNGALHTSVLADGGVPVELEGFRRVSPWSIQPFGDFHRQFVREEGTRIVDIRVVSLRNQTEVHVSGAPGKAWHADPRVERCDGPEAAVARAEALVAELRRDGFRLRLIELLNATRRHPAPPLARTEDPYDAVDAAVARIRALTREYPRGHFLVEELDPERDEGKLAEHGYDEFFIECHARKFNRWANLRDVARSGSSFDYFVERYGTLTWIVAAEIDEGLPMFYCGNVSGGGWSCLELGDLRIDMEPIEDCHPGRGYAQSRVFHGGWGRTGYLFDTRVATARGEHPIYEMSLDDQMPELMPEAPIAPDRIEAFGHWLEREVHQIASELMHRLPLFNAP